MRLSPEQRKIATAIYREMVRIKQEIVAFPISYLEKRASECLLKEGFRRVDYVSIAIPASLSPVSEWKEGTEAVVLVAAFLGEVRLIDNLLI
jgi:pantoate--beta-alanine ligase